MPKKKETPRTSVPNKKRVPSLYRKLESFSIDLTKRVDNVPGKPFLQEYVRRLANELVDCLTCSRYAYSTQDYRLRYDYLRDMEVHVDLIKSVINLLFEYASTTNSRFMTPEQHARYLIDLDEIDRQRKSWEVSTLKSIETMGSNVIAPVKEDPPQAPQSFPVNPFDTPESTYFMSLGEDRVVNNLGGKTDSSCCALDDLQ